MIGVLPITTEMPPIIQNQEHQRAKADDRRINGGDRDTADHQKGLDKPNGNAVGAVIGPIGGFEYGEEDYSRGSAAPRRAPGTDGLKLALALLYERRDECPGAVPILAGRPLKPQHRARRLYRPRVRFAGRLKRILWPNRKGGSRRGPGERRS